MNKEELKKKFEEVKNNIVANSKDAHFAKKLLVEYNTLAGQIAHEPTIVHVPIKDIEKEYNGDTFSMSICKDGTAVYHIYGGLTVVARANNVNLVGTISEYIDASKREMNKDEVEMLELDMSAFAYIMSLPMFAFGDMEFKYKLATMIVEYLNTTHEKAMDAELKDETIEDTEKNIEFENAMKAIEDIKDTLNESKS